MKLLALSLVLVVAAVAKAEDLSGSWSSPLGPLTLAQKSDQVVGSGKGKCGLPASGHLLEADILEDSLSGRLYVCLQECSQGPSWVPVLLLMGADGKTLSGTSTLPKGCKAPLGPNGSLIVRRQVEPAAAPPAKEATSATTPEPRTETNPPITREDAHPTPHTKPPTPTHEEPRPKEPPHEDAAARTKAMAIAQDGAAFLQEGKFEQARRRFQQAIGIDPLYAEGYNGIGITFFARNDYTEALRWYKRALGADPSFGDAYYNMACVYAVLNRKSLALRYLRTAFHKGYTSRETMRSDSDLASLRGDPTFEALLGEAQ